MKIYPEGLNRKESVGENLKRRLKAAANGFLSAMRAAREATDPVERKEMLLRAKRFKAYLERLGKNK